ncbi:PQQ-dependent sugar dehydrogenase [Falsiroseomonas sp. CW058]|uniref:PQQ-dependent sugar dehydrogenase n=1 Tax=Falsiroseomonas sp. CW058 TaxID=3388664 RepID=UPI003D30F816
MVRSMLAAGLVAAAFALPALAQAPAAPPTGAPPGTAMNPALAPHAPRMTVTPPDQLPVAALRLPDGFRAEVFAHGIPGARMMTEGPGGTIFVGTRTIGRVYAVSPNPDGTTRTRIVAQGLAQPNGVAMVGDSLYVMAINRVLRFDGIEARLDNPPAPADLTAAFNLPPDQHHGWKFLTLGPDGRLYTNVGVPCNICEFDRDRFALLVSFNPDGSDRRIEARGIRNSVGMGHHPVTRELWATNNARDWLDNDLPEDSLHRIRRSGEDHGFPYCVGSFADPGAHARRDCAEFDQPAALLGPHTAALGMRFYTGAMFPEAYRNAIFIARRGSWNRERLSGFDVVVAKLDAQGNVTGIEPFMTGWRDDANQRFLGRPVDVHVMRDGSLLVADEQLGAIYRVTYGR